MVPYALKDAIERDLNRLEKLGVVTRVNYGEWATPIVAILKPDGDVRICGDYKVTINPMLITTRYPSLKICLQQLQEQNVLKN